MGLLIKTDHNAKTTELESKIPSISGLATTFALTASENRIPNVSNLIKRTGCETKIAQIEKKDTNHNHDIYITTTPEFNKLRTENIAAILAQANLITKTDFYNRLYMSLNRKNNSNKTKHVKNEF